MHKEESRKEPGKLPKFKSYFEFREIKEDKYSQDRILEKRVSQRHIPGNQQSPYKKVKKKNVPSKYKAIANMYFINIRENYLKSESITRESLYKMMKCSISFRKFYVVKLSCAQQHIIKYTKETFKIVKKEKYSNIIRIRQVFASCQVLPFPPPNSNCIKCLYQYLAMWVCTQSFSHV